MVEEDVETVGGEGREGEGGVGAGRGDCGEC